MINLKDKQDDEFSTPANFGRLKILKNLFLLSLVFFITFTAYDCLSMLQSTLNHKLGIGVICQATSYGCYCISALLLPKYCIKKLGCKITLVLSMSLYLPYIASNLYPHWSFMVPTAAFSGFSASLLWGAQCQYVNELAVQYTVLAHEKKKKEQQKSKSEDTKTKSDDAVTPQSDIKYVITDCSEYDKRDVSNAENRISLDKMSRNYSERDKQNVSNSENGFTSFDISSSSIHGTQKKNPSKFISKTDPKDDSFPIKSPYEAIQKIPSEMTSRKDVESITARFFGLHSLAYLSTHLWSNVMSYFILQNSMFHSNVTLNESCVCGAQFCNEKSDCFVHNLQEPSVEKRYLLVGICLALGVVAIPIMALFLDSMDDRDRNVTFSFDFLLATGKQMKKVNQILLTPISFYIGMMQGFYTGDFNLVI